MTILLDGTAGITSPGGDTASVSLATPILKSPSSLTLQTNGSTTAVTVDTAQNVGIGVTPSSWSQNKALEIGGLGNAIWGNGVADIYTTSNTYYNGGWKYASTNGAGVGVYEINGSSHYWYASPSGTTGNAVTLTGIMSVRQGYTLALQGASSGVTGTGLSFPSSQNASSDANTLDDYEEGTWTPTDGSGAGLTLTSNTTSTYTKIGNFVYALVSVNYPSTGNTAQASIAGLPFAANVAGYAGGVPRYTTLSYLPMGAINPTATKIDMYTFSGGAVNNAAMSGLRVDFIITYRV